MIADLEAARDLRRYRPEAPPAHVAAAMRISVQARPLAEYEAAAGLEGSR